MFRSRTMVRAALVALGAGLVGPFALAAPAWAHVAIKPDTAPQGGVARLAFHVPTESDTASTTRVEVFLPENAPVPSASTTPVPGWTVTVERRKLDNPIEVAGAQVSEVVSKIIWTAGTGAGIKPKQSKEFPVSLGPLPMVNQMIFKVLQRYSDGTVVRWIDEPMAGGAEPEHAAPVLKLTPGRATPSATATPPATVTPSVTGQPTAAKPARASETRGDSNGPMIAGLVAGVALLLLAGIAFARARRRGGRPPAA